MIGEEVVLFQTSMSVPMRLLWFGFLAAKNVPSVVIVEFMRLPGPLIASVSAVPLNVAVSPTRPVSPSKASRPVLVATVPVAGV